MSTLLLDRYGARVTKLAKGTAVLLAYFGYCAAAMGTGVVVLIDARSNPDAWQPAPPLQDYVLGMWLLLFFVHLYGLFAPLLLPSRRRRRAYGYFLGAATVGLLTTTLLMWLWLWLVGPSLNSNGCGVCDLKGIGWFLAIVLGIGFVLPLAIAWWWRTYALTAQHLRASR